MRNRRSLMIGLLTIILLAVVSACSTSNTPANQNIVNIQGNQFSPVEITIKKGDSITWTNKDSVGHTIVSTTFQSTMLETGQSFTQAFSTVGTYEYHCSVHPSMVGKVIVTSSTGY